MTVRRLCHTQELAQNRSKGFLVDGQKVFLVRDQNQYFAYRNHCPHMGIALDWDNDQFLDYDGELIQCSSHGALFLIDNGKCVFGPCVGAQLQKLELNIENEVIYLLNTL